MTDKRLIWVVLLFTQHIVYASSQNFQLIPFAQGTAKDIETACQKARQDAISQAKTHATIWIYKESTFTQSNQGQDYKTKTTLLENVEAKILNPVQEEKKIVGRQIRCTIKNVHVQLDEQALEAQKKTILAKAEVESLRQQRIKRLEQQINNNQRHYQTMQKMLPALSSSPTHSQFVCPDDETLKNCLAGTRKKLETKQKAYIAEQLNVSEKYLTVSLLSAIESQPIKKTENGSIYAFQTQGKYNVQLQDPFAAENRTLQLKIQQQKNQNLDRSIVEETTTLPENDTSSYDASDFSLTPKWGLISLEFDSFRSSSNHFELSRVNNIYVGGRSLGFHAYYTGEKPKGLGIAFYIGRDDWGICTQATDNRCTQSKSFDLPFIQPSLHYNSKYFSLGLGWTHYLDIEQLDAQTYTPVGYATLWASFTPLLKFPALRITFGYRNIEGTQKFKMARNTKFGLKLLF